MLKSKFRLCAVGFVAMVLLVAGLIIRIFGPIDSFPRLYKTVRSSDGRFSVSVYRQKKDGGVNTYFILYDGQSHFLRRESLHQLDEWRDMDSAYSDIRFVGHELRIGPEHVQGDNLGYYILDLK